MGTVQKRAEKVKAELQTALPKRRKPVSHPLALAVGAMIKDQTPNTSELANRLPMLAARQDIREPGWRQLKNPLLKSPRMSMTLCLFGPD